MLVEEGYLKKILVKAFVIKPTETFEHDLMLPELTSHVSKTDVAYTLVRQGCGRYGEVESIRLGNSRSL